MRMYAIVRDQNKPGKTKHFIGLPPELTDNVDYRELMPLPDFVIIIQDASGNFLYRYTLNGDPGGDTWHITLQEAKEQAEWEYKISLDDWILIPDDVDDEVGFVIKNLAE